MASRPSSPSSKKSPEELYQERLARYVTALRNGMPDRVPVRPFAAEVTARYAGYTSQQITHDYRLAFEAVIRCCKDFDWDAAVPNMVYVWTGLTQAVGLRYYAVPGIDLGPDNCFQYREPPEADAFMKREEYDQLIADPTRFLYEVWLPRVSTEVAAGRYRQKIALVKGAMAMLDYFRAFGPQVERMRRECGTVPAISGMLKAPLDILGDKLRGYLGLALDLKEIPEKVLAACEALMPHLAHLALTSADPDRLLPIPIWMHRGAVPFISRDHFERIYWPTLKPIVEALWAQGNQVLFYAEGKWDAHLERFAELPPGSVIFHIDRTDPKLAHQILGKKFCLSGGLPNYLLAFGSPDEVRQHCRRLIEELGGEGGYILDASAIMQSDVRIENLKAMTEAAAEFGAYSSASGSATAAPTGSPETEVKPRWEIPRVPPGICLPFEESNVGVVRGDEHLVRRIWNEIEGFAYTYIWHLVLSF